MLLKLAAEKDGTSSIWIELLQIDRQIKIKQLNTVEDNRKFQVEYNAEKLCYLKEINKKRMEMLEVKRMMIGETGRQIPRRLVARQPRPGEIAKGYGRLLKQEFL